MAKKDRHQEPSLPPVNPELLQVEKAYRRESLIVEAKPRLRNALLLVWLTVDVILLAIFVTYFVTYILNGRSLDLRDVARIGQNIAVMHNVTESRAAAPLAINNPTVFASDVGYYDFYTSIDNDNADWLATFRYHFTSSQGDTESFDGFAIPGVSTPIAALHQSFAGRPTAPELVLEDLVWQRISGKDIPDVSGWVTEHNSFTIENPSYTFEPGVDDKTIPKTTFSIANNTSYGYWNAEFLVLIIRAGRVAGVNTVTIPGFASGEVRDIDLNWFGSAPTSGTVEVVPFINYFDDSVYMPPQGSAEVDIRDRAL